MLVGPVMSATATCYLVSDTSADEMLAFAERIGLRHADPHPHAGDRPRGHLPAADAHASWEASGRVDPHPGAPNLELTEDERAMAVAAGAREVSGRELEARCAGTPAGWRGHMRGG